MSLEKKVLVDKIEVIECGNIQVRQALRIIENGVTISETFHRHVCKVGSDISNEDPKVKAIAKAIWTDEFMK